MSAAPLGIVDEIQSRRDSALASARTDTLRARIWPQAPREAARGVPDARPVLLTKAEESLPEPALASPVAHAVAAAFGVGVGSLFVATKKWGASYPRFAFMLLLRRSGLSWSGVGKQMDCDHSSALYGARKAERLYAIDPVFAARFQAAQRIVAEAK